MFGPESRSFAARTMRAWLGRLSVRLSRRDRRRPRAAAARPLAWRVEDLEARTPPAGFSWSQAAPGLFNWGTAANWGGVGVPDAVGDTATINTALAGNETIALGSPFTVGTLDLGSTGGGFHYTLSGTGPLTFQAAGTADAALNEISDGGDAVDVPLSLGSNLTATNGGSGRLAVGGSVGLNDRSITFAGAGRRRIRARSPPTWRPGTPRAP